MLLNAVAVAFLAEATDEIVGVIDEKHGVDETRRVSSAHQKPTVSGDVGDVVFLS